MKFKAVKYIFFILIFLNIFITSSYAFPLPFLNDRLHHKGFIKKKPFHISIGYEYTDSDGFNGEFDNSNLYVGTVDLSNIKKTSSGVKAEADIYLTPFVKLFIDYIYMQSDLKIDYTIKKENAYNLTKDYSGTYSTKNEEHIYRAGFEAMYEWTIKNFSPYISFLAGFGATATSNYSDTFYNATFMAKAGTYITFNENWKLNLYAGADYTTLFNNGAMTESINISISEDYLTLGLPTREYSLDFTYEEDYDKNINMVLGAKLDIYKHIAIFFEAKFINSLTLYSGVNFMF